jgi:hypothetical protein
MARQLYRRYQLEFLPAMAAYMAVMILLWPQVAKVDALWLKWLLALLPMLPLGLAILAMVRLVLRSDEMEQRAHLIGLAVAAALVAFLSMAGGFLVAAHLVKVDGSILIWVFPVLVLTYAFVRGWAARRMGGSAFCEEDHPGLGRWLLPLAIVLAGAIGIWHSHMSDYLIGLLSGAAAGFALGGLAWLYGRWRGRDDTDASKD